MIVYQGYIFFKILWLGEGGNGCWGKKMKTEYVGKKNEEKEGKRGKGKRGKGEKGKGEKRKRKRGENDSF